MVMYVAVQQIVNKSVSLSLDFLKMGCLISKFDCLFNGKETSNENLNTNLEICEKKTYSWDQRPAMTNYKIENVVDETIVKNDNRGNQLVISNCTNSNIYALTNLNTSTIDDCNCCIFVLGPVKGSIFVRDCKNITLMAASSQVRLRDCSECALFLGTESDPVIENCQNITTAPYYLNYPDIEEDFKAANLSKFSCSSNWFEVYDFTPPNCGLNWSHFKGPLNSHLHLEKVHFQLDNPYVHITYPFETISNEVTFSSEEDADQFLNTNNSKLVHCKIKEFSGKKMYTLSLH